VSVRIDARDPRDPRDIMVEEGIHPHPGPRRYMTRKPSRLSIGEWLAFAIMCIGAVGANACNTEHERTNCNEGEYLNRCGNTTCTGLISDNRCSLTAARMYSHRPLGVTLNVNTRCMVKITAKREMPKAELNVMDREAYGNKPIVDSCVEAWDATAYESDDDAWYQAMDDDVSPWECGPGWFLGGNIAFAACVMVLSWIRRSKPYNLCPRGRRRTIIIVKAKRTGQGQPRRKDERLRRMACYKKRIALRRLNAGTCRCSQQSIPTADQGLQPETQPTRGRQGEEPVCELPRVPVERCPHQPPGRVKEHASGEQEARSREEEQRGRSLSAPRGRTPRVKRRRSFTLLCWLLVLAVLVRTTNAVGEDRVPPVETEAGYNLLWNRSRRNLCAQNAQTEPDDDAMVDDRNAGERSEALRERGSPREQQSNSMRLITANIHALQPRAEEVALWDADVIAVQETKLAAHAIRDMTDLMKDNHWRFVHGKPCAPSGSWKSRRRTKAATEANRGGVGIMIKDHLRPIATRGETQGMEVHACGRWAEVKIPLPGINTVLTVVSYYGVSGANSDPKRMAENETHLAEVICRALEAEDAPYLIMGDINVDPEMSAAVASAVDQGCLVDIGHEWAEQVQGDEAGDHPRKMPEPTFNKHEPPQPGMSGPGVSRIDAILANPVAASAVKAFYHRWDLVQVDHVPLQVDIELGELAANVIKQKTRGNVDHEGIPKMTPSAWDLVCGKIRSKYGPSFDSALARGDIDGANEYWSIMAEASLQVAKGMDVDEADRWIRKFPLRGAPPRFLKMMKAKPMDVIGHPTTHRQRQLNNVRNAARDLHGKMKRWRKLAKERAGENSVQNEEVGNDARSVWTLAKEIGLDTNAEELLWCKVEDRARKLLGALDFHGLVDEESDGFPTQSSVAKIIDALKNEYDRVANRRRAERRTESRARARWDWEHNHGRRAYAATKIAYTPPTTAILDPNAPGRYITSNELIHDEFMKYWVTIYRKHQNDGDQMWREFTEKYGDYIPRVDLPDVDFVAEDFIQQLDRMKNTSAGFDGWTKPALQALPGYMWRERARLENKAKQIGVLPSAFTHAPSPMLPKGQATHPSQHRGLVIYSYLHRMVSGIHWTRMRHWQEQWADPQQHGGRLLGEHLADAWDLQIAIEGARAEEQPLVGALLDYQKFFDMFPPAVAAGLLRAAGAPEGVVKQTRYLYDRLNRYIRVAGTYGAVIRSSNGIGQGCTISIVIANLFVATLCRYLRARHPNINIAAFIDDRNITATSIDDLLRALGDIKRFDEAAGHCTHLGKSVFFATEDADRNRLRAARVGEDKLKVVLDSVMVGHNITTRNARRTDYNSTRAKMATGRAEKVAAMTNATRDQKRRLVQQAVIPSAITGSLWNLPSAKTLTGLRNAITKAIWGTGRKQRCQEVVLGTICNATAVDPLAAITYRRLVDARRLLRKNINRTNYAIHVHEMQGQINGAEVDIFDKRVGPIQGLRQAAALIGATIRVADGDLMLDFGGRDRNLPMTKGPDGPWKARIRQAIEAVIDQQLNKRLTDPSDEGQRGVGRSTRKDIYGINGGIDRYATKVLLDGRATAVMKEHGALWAKLGDQVDLVKYANDPIWRQRLQAVISGSMRAPNRLHKAGLKEDARCPFCPAERATLDHLIWECDTWKDERAPFLDLLHNYREKHCLQDPRRNEEFTRLLSLPCVRNCGILPESTYFKNGGAKLPSQACRFAQLNTPIDRLSVHDRNILQYDSAGRVKIYTDGSATHPGDRRRRRAAWACFAGQGHEWNVSGPVSDTCQTVYRAELLAIKHAMAAAVVPTRIVTDCKSISDQLADALCGARRAPKGDHGDLWEEIYQHIDGHPDEYYEVEWVKSHIGVDEAEAIEAKGGFTKENIVGNMWVDIEAKRGMTHHNIDKLEYALADDREFIALVVQAMITHVWAKTFDSDPAMAEEASEGLWDTGGGPRREDQDEEAQQGDPEEDDYEDHQRETNQVLAKKIRREAPQYSWQSPHDAEDFDEIVIPENQEDVHYGVKGGQYIKGKGMVNVTCPCPPHLVHPIKWWFNQLKWRRRKPEQYPNAHDTTVTYLECAIDFELATGVRLATDGERETTWAGKARIIAAVIRLLNRVHGIVANGRQVPMKTALGPRADAPSLTPLGAPVAPGYGRKPVWVDPRTPYAVAANYARARRAALRASVRNRRTTGFAQHWHLNYEGFPATKNWTPPSIKRLATAVEQARIQRGAQRSGEQEDSPTKQDTSQDVARQEHTPKAGARDHRCRVEGQPPGKRARRAEGQTTARQVPRGDVFPEVPPNVDTSASSSTAVTTAATTATTMTIDATVRMNAQPPGDDWQPSKKKVKRPEYFDLTEDANGVVSAPKYTREQKRQACPLVQWTNVDKSGRGTLQSAWRLPAGEEQWGDAHAANGASSSGTQTANGTVACDRISNSTPADGNPPETSNRCSLHGEKGHQTEGRCGVCNVASKLLPFRRITRERWRGKPRGTLLCTRCHLKSRWHPDE
jgi:exonuclease III